MSSSVQNADKGRGHTMKSQSKRRCRTVSDRIDPLHVTTVVGHIDTSDESHRRQVTAGRITGLAWLALLGSPIAELFRGHHSQTFVVLGLIGLASFIAVYVYGFFRTFFQKEETWRSWMIVLLLTSLASALSLGLGGTRLVTMVFVVTAACCSLSEPMAIRSIVGISTLTVVVAALVGTPVTDIASFVFQLVLIGTALMFLRRLIRTNGELRSARVENARLAVSEERLRFARDLHDLLGHSLSLIALKSELAGRLIEVDPERAKAEVNDIEQVTRDALREVREAVSGYRQPALDAELAGARAALDAAGIRCDIVRSAGRLPPIVEATLGWAVREGVTNVIRHSGAARCDIQLEQRREDVRLTITDDGQAETNFEPRRTVRAGCGLAGLNERLIGQGGELIAGPVSSGGFQLLATIPIAQSRAVQNDPVPETVVSPRLVVELPQ